MIDPRDLSKLDKQLREGSIDPRLLKAAWKVSPLSVGIACTAKENEPYRAFAHTKYLSDKIKHAIQTGGRLIISAPPQFGKSQISTRWSTCWFLENFPDKQAIIVSYNKEYARDWGRLIRDTIVQNQDLFTVRLREDSKAADRWLTSAGGGLLSTGIDGGITGKRANFLLMDDLLKDKKAADSYQNREDVWQWFWTAAHTRIHNNTAIILIMTRWNADDIAGRLLKDNVLGFEYVNLPSVWDEEADREETCPLGRKVGDLLCPELHGPEKMRAVMLSSPETFMALYQGRPGSFVTQGNVYKEFDAKRNLKPVERDIRKRLFLSYDFNVDPMAITIGQYQKGTGYSLLEQELDARVEILDEVVLPNSSTKEATIEVIDRLKRYTGEFGHVGVEIYGDPAAKARHTSQVAGTDYDIIRDVFKELASGRITVTFRIKKKAPQIKERTNAVNRMLYSADKRVRMVIDPRCKCLRKDFEILKWKRDLNGNTTGQIDKSDPALSHISDSCSYAIEAIFGAQAGTAVGSGGYRGILQ